MRGTSDNDRAAWIAMPSEAEMRARGSSGGAYDFGFVPNMGRLIAAHPTIGPAFGALFGTIMFAPGALNRRERELVAAVAAAAQDCFY
jgi:alkylhydroperoxidase/carboxymuconolactone decarboxylase family protein YurZ